MKSVLRKKLTRHLFGSGRLTPQIVREYYDEWHQRYVDGFGEIFQAARMQSDEALMQHVVSACGMKEGMRVLDAGCGIGGPAILMAKLGNVIVEAITISGKQAVSARQNVEAQECGSLVNVSEGDFHHVADIFGSEHFDVVVFLETVSHSHDWPRLFEEVCKVLKPNGTLYIKDFFLMNSDDPLMMEQIRVATVNTNRYCRLWIRGMEELIATIEANGFVLESTTDLNGMVFHDIGRGFTTANDLDVYEGGDRIGYLDWRDLTFRKK